MKRLQPLPLKGINLSTAPVTKRALSWSCDAELAVAADDSLHVFVPLFPSAETEGAADDNALPTKIEEDNDDGADGGGVFRSAQVAMQGPTRYQYSSGMRHFPVSYPPLDVRVNRRLWEAQGLDFPYHAAAEQQARAGDEGGGDNDAYTQPSGAGSGTFTSAATTLNHVVAIEWSPAGVGRNKRAILAVLTASGTLVMYGEGPATPANRRKGGGSGGHDLSTWEVLWAVGERFVVPPQAEYGEAIISFAWAKHLGPRGAVLAYANDQGEYVFLTVRSDFEVAEGSISRERAVWTVKEVARLAIKGPHPNLSMMDFDYVPFGTNFGLGWTPWLKKDGTSIAIFSYMVRGYIGFRKVVVKDDGSDGITVEVGKEDVDGMCLYLGTDAFIEWEDTILTVNNKQICRGVIATPNQPRIFEVVLADDTRVAHTTQPHSQNKCNTIYPTPDGMHTNPIQSIVLRPVDTPAPYPTPIYTLVRLSATATNPDWYETNCPEDIQPSRPQWAVEIDEKVNIALPAAFASRDDDDDEEDDPLGDTEDEEEMLPAADDAPDVFIHRYRLWGLTASPGGGSTVAMGTVQSALKPDRGGWYHTRSRLMFGWVERDGGSGTGGTGGGGMAWRPGLSTEARVWEWMYGGGPEVQGVTVTAGSSDDDNGNRTVLPEEQAEAVEAARVKALAHGYFADVTARQRCGICEAGVRVEGAQTVCEEGHVFDTCSVSGVAIQAPGISRACGVCGLRSLKVPELVKMLPEKAEAIRRDISGDTCGGCGGKFLD